MTDPTIAGITLYNASSEDDSKDAQTINYSLPGTDSSQSQSWDIMGSNRTINIRGKFVVGDGGYTIAQYKALLLGLMNGRQNPKSYISESNGYSPLTVMIQTMTFNSNAGNPNMMDYSLSLVQCNNIPLWSE